MSTTSSTKKNYYGPRRRRKKKFNNMDRKIAKIARAEIAKNETEEVELKLYEPPEIYLPFIDNAGVIYVLTQNIAKGTDSNQRIGDQITLKSLFIRMFVRANLGSGNYHNMRIMIVRWNASGIPSVSNILDLTTNTQNRMLSQLSNNNSKNFQVLFDNTFLVSSTATYSIPLALVDKFYLKLRGKASWTTTGGNEKGNIYMLAISDSAAIDAPQLSYTARVRFTDQ